MTTPSVNENPEEAASKARFLAELAAAGIVLPPDRAEAADSDYLALQRQMRLIRAACASDTALPLGFAPASGDA